MSPSSDSSKPPGTRSSATARASSAWASGTRAETRTKLPVIRARIGSTPSNVPSACSSKSETLVTANRNGSSGASSARAISATRSASSPFVDRGDREVGLRLAALALVRAGTPGSARRWRRSARRSARAAPARARRSRRTSPRRVSSASNGAKAAKCVASSSRSVVVHGRRAREREQHRDVRREAPRDRGGVEPAAEVGDQPVGCAPG